MASGTSVLLVLVNSEKLDVISGELVGSAEGVHPEFARHFPIVKRGVGHHSSIGDHLHGFVCKGVNDPNRQLNARTPSSPGAPACREDE